MLNHARLRIEDGELRKDLIAEVERAKRLDGGQSTAVVREVLSDLVMQAVRVYIIAKLIFRLDDKSVSARLISQNSIFLLLFELVLQDWNSLIVSKLYVYGLFRHLCVVFLCFV